MTVPATSTWVDVCGLDDLPQLEPVQADVDGADVVLVRSGGQVFVLENRCTHEDVALSDGDVEDGALECWLHCSRFDLHTGAALNPPATKPVRTFAVQVRAGRVLVQRG